MVDMNLGTNMMVGCAWDKSGSSDSDLDTTVVLINEVGQVTDACYYNK
jgi:stress response protein SCP2